MPPSLGVSATCSPRPRRCATAAASVRLRTSSLARMRDTCTLAVFSAMKSCAPISRFVAPPATQREHLALARREPERVARRSAVVGRDLGASRLGGRQRQARAAGEALGLGAQPRRAERARGGEHVGELRRRPPRGRRAPRASPPGAARAIAAGYGRSTRAPGLGRGGVERPGRPRRGRARGGRAPTRAAPPRPAGRRRRTPRRASRSPRRARSPRARPSASPRSRARWAASASIARAGLRQRAIRGRSSEQNSIASSPSSIAARAADEVAAAALELAAQRAVPADELRLARARITRSAMRSSDARAASWSASASATSARSELDVGEASCRRGGGRRGGSAGARPPSRRGPSRSRPASASASRCRGPRPRCRPGPAPRRRAPRCERPTRCSASARLDQALVRSKPTGRDRDRLAQAALPSSTSPSRISERPIALSASARGPSASACAGGVERRRARPAAPR